MKKMSIKTSILLPTLSVLIAGIAAMVIIVGSLSSSTVNDLSGRLVSARVNEYTNKFEALCMDAYGAVTSLAPIIQDIGETVENPREEAVNILTGVLQANDDLVSIWTIWEPNAFDGMDSKYAGAPYHDTTGRFIPYVCKDGSSFIIEYIPDYEDGDFYQGARSSGKPYITDPYECDFGGKIIPVYTITAPVIKNGVVAGAVGIDINLSNVIDVMNAGSILDEGYLYVLSPNGTVTTHRNSDLILKGYESTWLKDYQAEIDSVLANGGNFTGTAYSDLLDENVRFLASGAMIGDTGRYWVVCGVVPERVVTASSTSVVLVVVGIGVLLIAIAGLTTFLIVRNRLKKLPVITAAAEAMARGEINLAGLEGGSEPTKNEISLLGRTFSSMAEGVKTQADILTQIADGDYSITAPVRSEADIMNKAINDMIERTNGVMNEIRTSSAQVSTASGQIADGAQTLAQGSTEQASAIEELSSSISEIAEMTKHNANIAKEASDLSVVIRGNAEKGNGQMDQMMQAVREINEASREIEKVIKIIDDIAFQTNILALNAAVEAARAGSAGKGFAVVAEEVRNLAAKSAEAAKDTGELIENSIGKANLGLNIATETSASLKDIVEGINRSAEIVAQITVSSEEQANAIDQVNIGIEQVTQVVQQNSATAEESASAAEELSGQSSVLAQMIARFKLKVMDYSSKLFSGSKLGGDRPAAPVRPAYNPDDGNSGFGKY